MDTEYELFERRSDGSLNWCGVAHGSDSIRVTLRLLSEGTGHVCFAVAPSGEVLAVGPGRASRAAENDGSQRPASQAAV
jgi:hypothetical protein